MEKPIYFISDLHLQDDCPELLSQFEYFITNQAIESQALYILGDLFEAWIGDDDLGPAATCVIQALNKLTRTGIPVYIMRGNRDFLLGRRFARQTGASYLADPCAIQLGIHRVLLSHGDLFCTDDVRYQRYRKIMYHPFTKWLLLSCSWNFRVKLASKLRKTSKGENKHKPLYIMDVNLQATQNAMQKFKVDYLIHGHTHRPQNKDGRIVLGAWDVKPLILRYQEGQFVLEKLPKP